MKQPDIQIILLTLLLISAQTFCPSGKIMAETSGLKEISISENQVVPYQIAYVRLLGNESISDIQILSSNKSGKHQAISESFPTELPTSESDRYSASRNSFILRERIGSKQIHAIDEIYQDGLRYARLLFFPLSGSSEIEINNLQLSVNNRELSLDNISLSLPESGNYLNPKLVRNSSAATRYLIVTGRNFVSSFEPLAAYKISIGLSTEIKAIEDITASYSGRDDAEKLREYLREFYNQGGEFLLLGGDETILPVRYVYPFSTGQPLDLSEYLLSDLYFADLTGQWDYDNDNLWGETGDDRADTQPELLVGRLPFNDSVEISNYTEKLIAYETNPGDGDLNYLDKSFFFSSDQMRDYRGVGQHYTIASAFPDWFKIDTVNGVESSSGYDISPNNKEAAELTKELSDGFGIVNIISHGRSDGFAVKTSEYNQWPKSYFLSDAQGAGHGSFDALDKNMKTSLYYSLSCDIGGFDLDQPPMNLTNPNLTQTLLSLEKSGAVAFVSYSRWGWISSSYLLQKSFYDSLFANPFEPAVKAMYASKEEYFYYKDLVYGQNFYGDPSLVIYNRIPEPLTLSISHSQDLIKIKVSSNGNPVSDADLILSTKTSILIHQKTDASGMAVINISELPQEDYSLASFKNGFFKTISKFNQLTTSENESTETLPGSVSLHQNFPNPFNPSTTISIELTEQELIELSIYNVNGRKITTLAEGTYQIGNHEFRWDGKNRSGSNSSSGIYFYRLTTNSSQLSKKMLLLK